MNAADQQSKFRRAVTDFVKDEAAVATQAVSEKSLISQRSPATVIEHDSGFQTLIVQQKEGKIMPELPNTARNIE